MSQTPTPNSDGESSLRVMFWNVRDLGQRRDDREQDNKRLEEIAQRIKSQQVDVAAIAEVVNPDMMYTLAEMLPGYVVQLNSNHGHSLATIFKAAADRSITVHQQDRFKSKDGQKGRPYTLIDITDHKTGSKVALVAGHQKSGSSQSNMNIRTETTRTIARMAENMNNLEIPFIFMGDMNTMGNGYSVDMEKEIERTDGLLYDPFTASNGMAYEDWPAAKMLRLPKNKPATWHGVGNDSRYEDSDFDHVYVSEWFYNNIKDVDNKGSKARVTGWTSKETTEEQDEWVNDISDHAPIFFDIVFPPKPS